MLGCIKKGCLLLGLKILRIIYACECTVAVFRHTRRGHWIHYRWLWLLGFELRTFGRALLSPAEPSRQPLTTVRCGRCIAAAPQTHIARFYHMLRCKRQAMLRVKNSQHLSDMWSSVFILFLKFHCCVSGVFTNICPAAV